MIIKTKQFIIIALVLLTIGVVFPLLMVVQVIKSTFLLNFFSYICSVIGLFIGTITAMTYVKTKRNK